MSKFSLYTKICPSVTSVQFSDCNVEAAVKSESSFLLSIFLIHCLIFHIHVLFLFVCLSRSVIFLSTVSSSVYKRTVIFAGMVMKGFQMPL